MDGLLIGGAPVVQLQADPLPDRPSVVEATILPGRGMMLLQASVALPSGERIDLLEAPSPQDAAKAMDGGPDDFAGNASFRFGGAILAPYANRIRGRPRADSREIETRIGDRAVRLPRNWGGQAPGAEAYAMHGLILAQRAVYEQPGPDIVRGRFNAGAFGDWPGRIELNAVWRLTDGCLRLDLEARNLGAERSWFSAGWHPYFRLPSAARAQARLRVPASRRVEVNDYDEVLPTGRLLDLAGASYDFSSPEGRALGEQYLDDCFTDLLRDEGKVVAEVVDPIAGLGFRLSSASAAVRAIQVYAPPDRAIVVVEPQFNLADPFSPVWPPAAETGMQPLPPGGTTRYDVTLSVFRVPRDTAPT